MQKILLTLFLLVSIAWGETLDFETAWERILYYSPALAAAEAQVCALKGEADQVGLPINPLLEVETENLGVGKPSDEVEPPQTTISLTQTIELGFKASARKALALAMSGEAYWEACILREQTYYDLTAAFIRLRIAHEKWILSDERLGYAESRLTAIKKQIANGRGSPLDEKRARLDFLCRSRKLREVKADYEEARISLLALWGGCIPDFETVDYALDVCTPPPCFEALMEGFYQTCDFTRARQAVLIADKNLKLQKVNQIPDLTVMGGYRIFHHSHARGWVVGAAMPLPLFNRNQGNVRSAESNLLRARYELDEVQREGNERLLRAYERFSAAYEECALLERRMLREAKESLQLTERGYDNGKVDYLDLIDAHLLLLDIQEEYLDLLEEYHLKRAELARISGLKL